MASSRPPRHFSTLRYYSHRCWPRKSSNSHSSRTNAQTLNQRTWMPFLSATTPTPTAAGCVGIARNWRIGGLTRCASWRACRFEPAPLSSRLLHAHHTSVNLAGNRRGYLNLMRSLCGSEVLRHRKKRHGNLTMRDAFVVAAHLKAMRRRWGLVRDVRDIRAFCLVPYRELERGTMICRKGRVFGSRAEWSALVRVSAK